MSSAKAWAVSVLPTPDGPASISTAIGRFGSASCAREVSTRLAMSSKAWSWPITRVFKVSARCNKVCISSLTMRPKGMPVHSEITAATACSSTSVSTKGSSPWSSCKCCLAVASCTASSGWADVSAISAVSASATSAASAAALRRKYSCKASWQRSQRSCSAARSL